MENAARTDAVNISLSEMFGDLAVSLHDCLLAVEAARVGNRAILPALRLAVRCLGSLFRLAHWQPSLTAALIVHVRSVLATANQEYQAARDSQRDTLGVLGIRITCQTYLTRLAEQQSRAAKHADRQQQRAERAGVPPRPTIPHHGPHPSSFIVGDLATPLAQMPPAVAAYVFDRAGIKSPPPLPPLTQRAKWLAAQRHQRNQPTAPIRTGDT